MHFYTIDCIKAGYLRKTKGVWYLTPEGEGYLHNLAVVVFPAVLRSNGFTLALVITIQSVVMFRFSVSLLFAPICFLAFFASGCQKNPDDTDRPQPGTGTLIDQGFIPALVNTDVVFFQAALYNNGFVFVATSDGVWKNEINTKQWSRAGLNGKRITALYKHPELPGKFFAGVQSDGKAMTKTVYLTSDGGNTWSAANQPVFENTLLQYENYACFAARPGHPNHIYANVEGGAMIAVSLDGGENWVRMNNMEESYFGYAAAITFVPGNAAKIIQGAEAPLDDAWLASYDIDPNNPVLLTNYTKLIDMQHWGNRRPNKLQTHTYTGAAIYVGQEGALSKVVDGATQFIFKSNDGDAEYPYIKGIWVDPADTNHLLFGGLLNHSEQPMSLYETYDQGKTIKRIENKMGIANPQIKDIVSTDSYPAIIVNDQQADKVKLLLYKPSE
jgi:hypothetical protein